MKNKKSLRLNIFVVLIIAISFSLGCSVSVDKEPSAEIVPKEKVNTHQNTRIPSVDTPVPTITEKPIKRPTHVPETNTPEMILGNQIVLLDEWGFGSASIYVLDVDTGNHRILGQNINITEIIEWTNSGCELIVRENDGSIVKMDLKGNEVKKIFSSNKLPEYEDGVVSKLTKISSDKNYVLYPVGYGDYINEYPDGYYELQDIEVIGIQESAKPLRISSNGGAFHGEWAPIDPFVAYSDYDEVGIHQLFLYDVISNTHQKVTNFQKYSLIIDQIAWSSSGSLIAVEYQIEGEYYLDIYNISTSSRRIFQIKNAGIQWWLGEEVLISSGNYNGILGIHWWDVQKQEIIRSLSWESPYGDMRWPQPFGDQNQIGFYNAKGEFYIYDVQSEAYIHKPNGDLFVDIDTWIAGALNFKGESYCK
jgi:hypothetical protein